MKFVDGMDDIEDEDVEDDLEDDARRDETRDSQDIQGSPQLALHRFQNDNIPWADSSPRTRLTVNSQPYSPNLLLNAEHGILHSPQYHEDFGSDLFGKTSISNTRYFYQQGGEAAMRRETHAPGSTRISLLSPSHVRDGGRQDAYNVTLAPITSLGNEKIPLPSAAGSQIPYYSKELVTPNILRTPRDVMKFFIDKVAPWVCAHRLSQWLKVPRSDKL